MQGSSSTRVAAALGLSALLAASAEAYEAVRIAGALYLLWLAFGALRHGAALKLKANAARGGLAAPSSTASSSIWQTRRSCCSS